MADVVVETEELSRRYGKRWALARVSYQVQRGERFLVVGANGSGKTTMLRVLSTAIGPSKGRMRIFGMDPTREGAKVRAHLGLLSHLPAVYWDLSGPENLRVLFRLMGVEDHPEPYLERVGLEVRPDPVRGYSAGMRKRLSFARLLAQKPKLALIDEPYGQLDPSGFDFVDRLLVELTESGSTVIVASHQVDRARHICDRALLLDKGQNRWLGPAVDVSRAWTALHHGRPLGSVEEGS